MTIVFPVIIFLILYNVPSGLVLYWTAYTFFGILQDFYFKQVKDRAS